MSVSGLRLAAWGLPFSESFCEADTDLTVTNTG